MSQGFLSGAAAEVSGSIYAVGALCGESPDAIHVSLELGMLILNPRSLNY